ncbi:unnamed protein product [Paramecium pentaurelia]|uniref:Beta-lactamase class A catalytic domain-containing protein n=1 Tax=Paramecium pentaurelia TaxID=43138 RepID=A0A8S1WBB6_9CILI|nr:unnamed protein product [Paramecium pentaurelia]
MFRGSHFIFLSCILLAIVSCEFIPTDEANFALFNVIKQAYNSDNFALIYQQLDDEVQQALSLKQFEEILVTKKSKTGSIEYWSYSSPIPQHPIFILGFQKNLAVGSIEWEYQETKFKVFLLKEFVEPTFVEFLKRNPSRTSLSAKTDDIEILNYQGNRQQDLMSVFKITVAIEFSRQSAEGIIDPDTWVSLEDVNKYYLKDVDTSHTQFLEIWNQMGKIKDDKIQLIEIANGMIALSSNTNTEYLQTILTMESIEKTIQTMKLEQTQSYYLSSLFLVFLNYDNKDRDDYIKQISSFTPEYVLEKSNQIHSILEQGGQEAQDLLARGKEVLDGQVLGIQAQTFTKASTSAYVNLLDKLNKQEIFNSKFYDIFYPLIGYVSMKNPFLAKTYKHVGVKGGSSSYEKDTQCVLSIAQFQELYNPFPYSKTTYALFTQDLDYETEYAPLITQFNYFTGLISLNGYYLQAVSKALTSISLDENIFEQ